MRPITPPPASRFDYRRPSWWIIGIPLMTIAVVVALVCIDVISVALHHA